GLPVLPGPRAHPARPGSQGQPGRPSPSPARPSWPRGPRSTGCGSSAPPARGRLQPASPMCSSSPGAQGVAAVAVRRAAPAGGRGAGGYQRGVVAVTPGGVYEVIPGRGGAHGDVGRAGAAGTDTVFRDVRTGAVLFRARSGGGGGAGVEQSLPSPAGPGGVSE